MATLVATAAVEFLHTLVEERFRIRGQVDFLAERLFPLRTTRCEIRRVDGYRYEVVNADDLFSAPFISKSV